MIAGVNILEFIKMAEIPEVIRAKAQPCMFILRSIPSMLVFLFASSFTFGVFLYAVLILLGSGGMFVQIQASLSVS